MKNNAILREHEGLNERMSAMGINPSISVSDKHGIGVLVHADFEASEGEYSAASCLMLNLCTAHAGRMRRIGNGPRLEGVLRPGTVAIALPETAASGYWPKIQMLGIAVSLESLSGAHEDTIKADDLHGAASQLHNDPLLSAVMTALWRDAEFHGLSGAFFEQGVHVLLKRLSICRKPANSQSRIHPLAGWRLQQSLDLIESRLNDDIRVSDLATQVGQDVRTFTRSFAAATGLAPYAYFTMRRMEMAKQLLENEALSITAIALHLGYANPSKFAAAFSRIHGIPPSVWRRLYGKS